MGYVKRGHQTNYHSFQALGTCITWDGDFRDLVNMGSKLCVHRPILASLSSIPPPQCSKYKANLRMTSRINICFIK